ncbi:MAG: DUF1566 domain-containing protein [Deltaproteobacteria bacterium]|nr:DUF1566 domain-containing protein [Deltaproteobacteria bacterium]
MRGMRFLGPSAALVSVLLGCADGTGGPQGSDVRIAAQAVSDCGSWAPDPQPGVQHQTPAGLRAGVNSAELLRGMRDPDPLELPLAGEIVELDLDAGGVLVQLDDAQLAEGSYSHIRIGLAYAVYTVRARAHAGVDVAGQLRIDMALSSHQGPGGVSRSQGQYTASFSAYGQTQTFSGATTLDCTLSAWGGIAETSGEAFRVTVPLPGGPVEIGPGKTVSVELRFPVRDGFGWRDVDAAGFVAGEYDVAMPPEISELPDALLECSLFMADRCQGEAVVPLHPTWPMPDCPVVFFSDGQQVVDACPAEGQPASGQDACYSIHPPDYGSDGERVHDRVTGLDWQRLVPEGELDWWQSRDYCAALDLAGFEDWRLPSRIELVSLLDFSRVDPTIDLDAFPDTPSEFFWTASPVPFANLAYGVRFELGFIYDHDPFGSGRVRCVRGQYEPPAPRYRVEGDVVRDLGAGLVWQRESFAVPMGWLDALAACEDLSLDSREDWRLPTLKELQVLVDGRRMQPSIDVQAFAGTPPEWFWSSTPIAWPPDQGWATSYTDGYASIHDFDELHRVRCVCSDE